MLAEPLPSLDPVAAAAALRQEDGFLWLDSAGRSHPEARFSYLCVWPVDRLRLPASTSSLRPLRTWLSAIRGERLEGGAPFQGGAAGYVAYDFAPAFVDRFVSRHAPASADALELGFYDTVIAFDHAKGTAAVYSAGVSALGSEPDERRARTRIDQLKAALAAGRPAPEPPDPPRWQARTGAKAYAAAVARTQEFIRDGDIYQANLAALWQGLPAEPGAAFANYLSVRERAKAPFSAFGVFSGRTIASFSPERLVSLDSQGRAKAEPIKGTIRRGMTEAEDAVQRSALLSSEKDRAENVMIVDLLRNDLSRVCAPQSVNVSSLCRLETFANLHHLVSTVDGQMSPSKDSLDLLMAVFPGGSITGAPKLRAMEIIDLLEPEARGVFCGSIGWIGFDGAMDFSILIRSLDIMPDQSRFWAGAGITLLSDPESEWDEVRLKAERLIAPGLAPASAA